MNCVVCTFTGNNEELRIENPFFTVLNIPSCHRVHVMNQKIVSELVSRNAQITTIVSENNKVTHAPPLGRLIESLIKPSIVSESRFANLTSQAQIVKAF